MSARRRPRRIDERVALGMASDRGRIRHDRRVLNELLVLAAVAVFTAVGVFVFLVTAIPHT